MRVLFVYRGQRGFNKKPIVENQIKALNNHSDIEVFQSVIENGGLHYLKQIPIIRKIVKRNNIDLIHAHYSISGFFSSLAFTARPVICSLMGSDIWDKTISRSLVPLFYKRFWSKTIVKSKAMQQYFPKAIIIPNGVDFDHFWPLEKSEALQKTGFTDRHKNIVFVSTISDMPVKNISLAKQTFNLLEKKHPGKYKLNIIEKVDHENMPYYYRAADVLLLTSFKEGSPNVIKEALACDCPVVSTDVGDVKSVLEDIDGSYISTYSPEDIADKIVKATSGNKAFQSREKIRYLDNQNVIPGLIKVYESTLRSG